MRYFSSLTMFVFVNKHRTANGGRWQTRHGSGIADAVQLTYFQLYELAYGLQDWQKQTHLQKEKLQHKRRHAMCYA